MTQKDTDELTRILLSPLLARAVLTITDLGIADHIEPGAARSVAYLAQATGCHEHSLYRALRLLASHGVFSERADGEFDHTALSQDLRSRAEGSYRAGADLFHYVFHAMDQLDHSIRTGESGFTKVFGKPLFEHVQEHPELAPVFDAGMTSFHGFETGAMLDAYDFASIGVLADIGGGNGSLIASVLKRYPRLRGILFDLGHVSARAGQSLAAQGLAERCQVIEGNFFESVPPGADAYLLRHVLHDWTNEQCTQILDNCRRAMGERGRLLVVECVVPAGNARSISKDYDMLMMLGPGGLERTETQFRALLKTSGFELTSVTPTSSMVSVVEARPIPV
jgi:O-methyltransferase domain